MHKNTQLNHIISTISQYRLGKGICDLENFLMSHPYQPDIEELNHIKDDYNLMADYWKNGYDDPQRQHVYTQLLHRLYHLIANIVLRDQLQNNAYLQGLYQRPRQLRRDWAVSTIKKELESYVTDIALLELEPQHVASEKRDQLNRQHQNLMCDLFDYIATSQLWNDSTRDSYLELFLSPTIDIHDQLLLVSAVSMSAMNVFDPNKFKVLASLYQQVTDVQLRQRALVGWVFALDSEKAVIYPEIGQMIKDICDDENNCKELTELQIQLYYCMDTDTDQRTIRDEIMPDLMDGNHFKVTRHGLMDVEEDSLEDILHPEESERKIEKMEQGMHRMSDMQKQGSDIYYGGFSQMKRFPFFQNYLSNWFAPFSTNHPDIHSIWKDSKNHKFLSNILGMGGFCDSDKYSFVLAYHQIVDHLPASVMKMIDAGEAAPMPVGGQVNEEERKTPAFNRRMYLQNLYRFYRLHYMRREFPNPFENSSVYLFFSNSLFVGTLLESHFLEISSFLMKRNHITDALRMIEHVPEHLRDYQYYMIYGNMLRHQPQTHYPFSLHEELHCYEKAHLLKPEETKAMAGLARISFRLENYTLALSFYEKLLERQPENRHYMLNAAFCLINQNQCDQAEKYLFKLNYLYPDDQNVIRGLARLMTLQGRFEQARKYYIQLLSVDQPMPLDFLNYGYCLWFSRDEAAAIVTFKKFMVKQAEGSNEDKPFNLENEFMIKEHDSLLLHNISDVEIQLMIEAVLY